MLKAKFYSLVMCFIFAVISLTSISLASSDIPNVRNFEFWDGSPEDAKSLGFTYLETLKSKPDDEVDEETLRCAGASFSGFLYHYEVLDLSPSEKEDLAIKIRELESILAGHMLAGKINYADLWLIGMPDIELTEIDASNLGGLLSTGKLSEPPPHILDAIKAGDKVTVNLTAGRVSPRFSRLPSTFEGNLLLVGGERAVLGTRQEFYMLNFDSAIYPDIVGYAENLSSLVAMPDSKFTSIEFDFLDHGILLDEEAVREYYRILAPGGTFTFKTNHNSVTYCQNTIKAERKQAQKNLMKLFGKAVIQEDKKDPSWPTKSEAYYVRFQAIK